MEWTGSRTCLGAGSCLYVPRNQNGPRWLPEQLVKPHGADRSNWQNEEAEYSQSLPVPPEKTPESKRDSRGSCADMGPD